MWVTQVFHQCVIQHSLDSLVRRDIIQWDVLQFYFILQLGYNTFLYTRREDISVRCEDTIRCGFGWQSLFGHNRLLGERCLTAGAEFNSIIIAACSGNVSEQFCCGSSSRWHQHPAWFLVAWEARCVLDPFFPCTDTQLGVLPFCLDYFREFSTSNPFLLFCPSCSTGWPDSLGDADIIFCRPWTWQLHPLLVETEKKPLKSCLRRPADPEKTLKLVQCIITIVWTRILQVGCNNICNFSREG